jgi:PKD repeat protein
MSEFHVGRVVRRTTFLSLVMLSFTLVAFGQGSLGITVTADATPPIGQAPLTVGFSATCTLLGSSTAGSLFFWSFGDGSDMVQGQNVSHTYFLPGTYIATVTVTPPGGSVGPNAGIYSWIAGQTLGTASATVVVLPDYFYVLANANPGTGPIPLTVKFTSTIKGDGFPPFTYLWDFGDWGDTSTAANPTYTYTRGGIYAVKVVVTDSKGWQSTGMTTVFAAVPGLVVTTTAAPTSGYAPLGVGFVASASGGTPPYIFQWSFGDGTTGAGSSVSHTYANPGSYAAMVTVTDSTGSLWTATPAASVTAYPQMVGPPMP